MNESGYINPYKLNNAIKTYPTIKKEAAHDVENIDDDFDFGTLGTGGGVDVDVDVVDVMMIDED
jgi:hypothetical protein